MKITKKSKILAIVFAALAAASVCTVCSVSAMADENQTKSEAKLWETDTLNYQKTVIDGDTYFMDEHGQRYLLTQDPPAVHLTPEQEAMLFGENFGTDPDHQCVENPSYLTQEQIDKQNHILPSNQIQSDHVWDLSSKGPYQVCGEWGESDGQPSIKSNFFLTGQDSYTVNLICDAESVSALLCLAFDASTDQCINGISVGPGQAKSMTLTTPSNIYLEFRDISMAETTAKFAAIVS